MYTALYCTVLYAGLALMESGLLLSTLIKKFKFTVPKGYKAHYAITITLTIKDGLPVKVQRRE